MKHKFWLENPMYLFKTCKVIPVGYMSLEEQMNCVSRLVLFIFIILFLLGYKQSLLFLILSIIFIIILYYLQKSKMSTCEFFNDNDRDVRDVRYVRDVRDVRDKQKIFNDYKDYLATKEKLYNEAQKEYINKRYTVQKFPTYYVQQVEKEQILHPTQQYYSRNNNLVGNANPKTKIAPIHVAPMYDFEYWKEDDFTVPNIINEKNVQDYYSSGYYIEPENRPKNENCKQNFIKTKPAEYNHLYNEARASRYIKETFEDEKKDKKDNKEKDKEKTNKNDRYEDNLLYGLPYAYDAPSYMKRENVTPLNHEIFRNSVVPGVYYDNEVIEPISSMIGVSYTQQPPAQLISRDKQGNLIYDAKDPRFYKVDKPMKMTNDYVSNVDVYDPRTNGYGTSYRGYLDKMTGKPRYFYDDIESVRRPNYITRNNIDHIADRAPNYGAVLDDTEDKTMNERIRETANNAFKDDMIDFRTDMMERLMRKRNAEMWQLRVAPKSGRQFSTMTLK